MALNFPTPAQIGQENVLAQPIYIHTYIYKYNAQEKNINSSLSCVTSGREIGSDCRNEHCTIDQKAREREKARGKGLSAVPIFVSSPLAKIITPIYKLSTRRNHLKGPSSRLPGKAMAEKCHKNLCNIAWRNEMPVNGFQWQGNSTSVLEFEGISFVSELNSLFFFCLLVGTTLRTSDINWLYVCGPVPSHSILAALIASGAWPIYLSKQSIKSAMRIYVYSEQHRVLTKQ